MLINMLRNDIEIITAFLIMGIAFVFFIYFYFKVEIDFKKKCFKIARISDNLGNDNYKIVGSTKEGEFLELLELKEFRLMNIRGGAEKVMIFANGSWEKKEDAEKELNNFLIIIGQVKNEKKIDIIN